MLFYVRCAPAPAATSPASVAMSALSAGTSPAPAALSPESHYLLETRGARVIEIPEIPGRKDLKFLDTLPRTYVTGSTPSLSDIAAQPDVAHLGQPVPDPHHVREPVRVIVHGSDAALAAVVSKLMRIDALWVQVGFIPSDPARSTVSKNWGLLPDATTDAMLRFALESPALPTALIRDDHGQVVLGAVELTGQGSSRDELIGEVIVDSDTLYRHDPESGQPGQFRHGVRMVPSIGAPGLVAVPLPAPIVGVNRKGLFRLRKRSPEPPILTGRALQAGGVEMRVSRDGLDHPRPLTAVTFYRHLRDGQFVRN